MISRALYPLLFGHLTRQEGCLDRREASWRRGDRTERFASCRKVTLYLAIEEALSDMREKPSCLQFIPEIIVYCLTVATYFP
jgi:hypothetical protein